MSGVKTLTHKTKAVDIGMPGPDPRARKREIEVELRMIQTQLANRASLAEEVRNHLESKRAALEAERVVLDGRLGAEAATS